MSANNQREVAAVAAADAKHHAADVVVIPGAIEDAVPIRPVPKKLAPYTAVLVDYFRQGFGVTKDFGLNGPIPGVKAWSGFADWYASINKAVSHAASIIWHDYPSDPMFLHRTRRGTVPLAQRNLPHGIAIIWRPARLVSEVQLAKPVDLRTALLNKEVLR